MGFYVGKNGRVYENYEEMKKSDDMYDQIQETQRQSQLIEEQNDLIRRQAIEKRNLELQKEILERDKMRHESVLRIQKNFDSIGLSYDLFQEFMDNLSTDMDKETIDSVQVLDKKMKKLEADKEKVEADMPEKICFSSNDTVENITKITGIQTEYEKRLEKNRNIFLIVIIVAIVFLLLNIFSFHLGFFFTILAIIVIVIFLLIFNRDTNTLRTLLISRYYRSYEEVKETGELALIQKKIDDLLEKKENILQEVKQNNWSYFEEFRKKHYNIEVEKVLYDVKDEYDVKIKMFTEDNSKGKGTIEDYIQYMTKHISSLEK